MTDQQELIFALDIGTRSVIGVVGYAEQNGLHVLAVEREEHAARAMIDGQIQNIDHVARTAAAVRARLEERVGRPLTQVCVAAAGRSLRTQRAEYELAMPDAQRIDEETIARLESEALRQAEQAFAGGEDESERMYYLVGHSVTGYELDHYPMTSLLDHRGGLIKVSLIATFLPGEVVDSLCMAMHKAGMEVAGLTLEPIAAMNLIIPPQLRLLNLALVDIGAGTSDIAISQDGSVVGYTMATVAGDEITESIMKQYLLDFETAERVKLAVGAGQPVTFCDVLGLEHTIPAAELEQAAEQAARALSHEISSRVRELNGGAPSAIFLVGGGSQLGRLRQYIGEELQMDGARVAVGGSNQRALIQTDGDPAGLQAPEMATPLGIALSAAQQLMGSGLRVTINGRRAILFRSDRLSIRDVLLMNGYRYRDFISRAGRSVSFRLDDARMTIRGTPGRPAELTRNGEPAALSDRVCAGDALCFVPAVHGQDAQPRVRDVVPDLSARTAALDGAVIPIGLSASRDGTRLERDTRIHSGDVIRTQRVDTLEELIAAYGLTLPIWRNGAPCTEDAPLQAGDHITTQAPAAAVPTGMQTDKPAQKPGSEPEQTLGSKPAQPPPAASAPAAPAPAAPAAPAAPRAEPIGTLVLTLNGRPLRLPLDSTHTVYRLLDVLEYTDIDFDRLENEVVLEVNGASAPFQQRLYAGDQVHIYEKTREGYFT